MAEPVVKEKTVPPDKKMAELVVKEKTVLPVKKMAAHPKISVMVCSAIMTLENKRGSSLQAINKYISTNYDADPQKLSHHIKKYLRSAVESGELIQLTGTGASGSFKIRKPKLPTKPKAPKVKPPKVPKAFIPNKSPVKSTKSGEEADPQKLVDHTKNLKSADEIGELVQPTEKGVSGPSKIRKQKSLLEPKALEVKSSNRLKMTTSTPERTLKPKKAFKMQNKIIPDGSPVKSMTSGYEEEAPADATFTTPETNVIKRPKVALKTKIQKSSVYLPVKVKKPRKLKKQTALVDALPGEEDDPQKQAHHTKNLKSADEIGELVKPTEKAVSDPSKIRKQKPLVEPISLKIKPSNRLKMTTSTAERTLKPKKASKMQNKIIPDGSPEKSMTSGYEEEAPADATFTTPETNVIKRPKVAVKTKIQKSRVKVKKPRKLGTKKIALVDVLLGEEDDPQKLAHHTENSESAVQIGELVQPTENEASCSYKIRKQKSLIEPKEPAVKPSKMPIRTVKMTLKKEETSKIPNLIIPNESHVKSMIAGYDEESPADATFTTPIMNMTKKPKIAVKTKAQKSRVFLHVEVKKPNKSAMKKVTLPEVVPKEEPCTPTTFIKPPGTPYPKSKKNVNKLLRL